MVSQAVIIMTAALSAVIILPMIVIFTSSVYYLWCCKLPTNNNNNNNQQTIDVEEVKECIVDDTETINEDTCSDYEPPFTILVTTENLPESQE